MDEVKIVQREGYPTGYYEPQVAFTHDKEGMPVYPKHVYFSSFHKLKDVQNIVMTDKDYLNSILE